jgi:hypothetical protein
MECTRARQLVGAKNKNGVQGVQSQEISSQMIKKSKAVSKSAIWLNHSK